MSRTKVTISINEAKARQQEVTTRATKPEVRYGPYGRHHLDDPLDPLLRLLPYDMSARLHTQAINDMFGSSYPDGIMAYLTAYKDMEGHAPVHKTDVERAVRVEDWREWLQSVPFGTVDLGYRLADLGWRLPFSNAAVTEVTFKVGNKTSQLQEGPNWVADKTPQELLDSTPDTPENADLIALYEKMVAEQSLEAEHICPADVPGPPDYKWYVHDEQDIRSLFYAPGVFKSTTRDRLQDVVFDGKRHFESFKLLNNSEYVVTKAVGLPSYEDALASPAAPPKKVGNNSVKTWLVPRTWRADLTYTKVYGTRGGSWTPSAPQTTSFYLPALTNALVLQGSWAGDFLATPNPILSKLYVKSASAWDPSDLGLSSYLVMCSRVGHYWSFIDEDVTVDLWGRYAATLHLKVADSVEGQLVAAVETFPDEDHRYFVFRKTTVSAPEDLLEIYNGQFDDPRYVSNELVDTDWNLNQMMPTSFTEFNPDNAPISVYLAWEQVLPEELCAGGYPYFMEAQTQTAVHDGLELP